ncbi:MAG: hypothetical protein NT159_13990 [Proteobacteria bacterium]|nr:hypothetical protein [Pseudomonadota bacterium]
MIISKSNLALASTHHLESSNSSIARYWQDASGAPVSFDQALKRRAQAVPAELLQIETGLAKRAATKPSDNPFQTIMEMLLGIQNSPDVAAATDLKALSPVRSPFDGMQLMELTHTSESESCSFAASGNICLADGSTRQFDVGYRMDRSEQSTHLGVAQFKDPLALDFGEPTTHLSAGGVDFDINSDGKTENLRLPTGNSAVLFNDRNHNGKADDGSELFGPQSGNGFSELAKLDGDGNGWIDSGDAAYADLKLWQLADDGTSSVKSLADVGIGALATASAQTPFTIKENGQAVAQVRASGVWLGEHSGAGVVRQIDVGVTPAETPSA